MAERQNFAKLRNYKRVWAIASIHGESERLKQLHRALEERLASGDRIVYLGNMLGHGPAVAAALDEIITFRGLFLAQRFAFACDVCYLRGSQEEMWQKLLQIQFATDPRGVLQWMMAHGVEATLNAYGGKVQDALRDHRAMALTRWTQQLRRTVQSHPGHWQLLSELRRAAYTEDGTLLFVNAGVDSSRPLEAQNDSFWWGGDWKTLAEAGFQGFTRVVRGYDPAAPGLLAETHRVTLDGGCGRGGPLLAACFAPSGEIVDQLEA